MSSNRGIDFNLPVIWQTCPWPSARSFTEVRDEPDQARQVELLARNARIVLERAGPLQWAIRVAAEHEPELGEIVARYNAVRLRTMRTFVEWIAERGPLRDERTIDEAALTYWTVQHRGPPLLTGAGRPERRGGTSVGWRRR